MARSIPAGNIGDDNDEESLFEVAEMTNSTSQVSNLLDRGGYVDDTYKEGKTVLV